MYVSVCIVYLNKHIWEKSQEVIHSPYGMHSETFCVTLCCFIYWNAVTIQYIDYKTHT